MFKRDVASSTSSRTPPLGRQRLPSCFGLKVVEGVDESFPKQLGKDFQVEINPTNPQRVAPIYFAAFKPSCNDQKAEDVFFCFHWDVFSWQNKSQSEIVYISKYLHKPKIISTVLESNLSKKIRPKPTTSMNIYVEIYTMTSRSSNNSTSIFSIFFHSLGFQTWLRHCGWQQSSEEFAGLGPFFVDGRGVGTFLLSQKSLQRTESESLFCVWRFHWQKWSTWELVFTEHPGDVGFVFQMESTTVGPLELWLEALQLPSKNGQRSCSHPTWGFQCFNWVYKG